MKRKSTPGTFSAEKKKKTLQLHELGYSNVAIGREIGLSNSAVCGFIRSQGLLSNGRRKPELVGENSAKCKICKKVKDIGNFLQKDNFRLSMCKTCWNAERYKTRNRSIESQLKYKFTCLKNRARRENIAFKLLPHHMLEMWDRQKGMCFYTDIPLTAEVGAGRKPNSMSVDRIRYNEGYIEGNVVLCADRINTMKQNASLEEMSRWMPEWHARIIKFMSSYDDPHG